jgi:hypothetical protein
LPQYASLQYHYIVMPVPPLYCCTSSLLRPCTATPVHGYPRTVSTLCCCALHHIAASPQYPSNGKL